MSNGKLKAQYNRVRTSVALQGNSMWNTTIGVEQDAGANSAIEASLRAPNRGGGGVGGGREARRQAAQDLIDAAGYQPAISTFEELSSLARSKNIGNELRGACKVCGGLGHLTKQCRNQPAPESKHSVGGAAAGLVPIMQLIPPDSDKEDSISSLSSSSSGSDSDDSSERRRKRKRREKSASRKEKSSSKGHKHRKEKSSGGSKEKRHKSSSSSKEKRHKSSSSGKEKRHKSSRQE